MIKIVMPRKTLALISGLVIVTIILFIIALRSNNQLNPPPPVTQTQPSPTSAAHSVLMLSPNPVMVKPGAAGSVDVMIDTADNNVTAVQLELAYDPKTITNVKLTPGTLFTNPVVLINKNDTQAGRITYAFGIAPNQQTIQGKGVVATISFTATSVSGSQSQITLLPLSLITARGIATSVMKSATGTTVMVGETQAQGEGIMQHASPAPPQTNY
jgi:hypothetical protein